MDNVGVELHLRQFRGCVPAGNSPISVPGILGDVSIGNRVQEAFVNREGLNDFGAECRLTPTTDPSAAQEVLAICSPYSATNVNIHVIWNGIARNLQWSTIATT